MQSELDLFEEAATYYNNAATMMERISPFEAEKYYGKYAEISIIWYQVYKSRIILFAFIQN